MKVEIQEFDRVYDDMPKHYAVSLIGDNGERIGFLEVYGVKIANTKEFVVRFVEEGRGLTARTTIERRIQVS